MIARETLIGSIAAPRFRPRPSGLSGCHRLDQSSPGSFLLRSLLAVLLLSCQLTWAQDNQTKPRIVALAPHLVEILYAVGAGDRLVGAVDHSDFPKQALSIPRVGNYTAINVEAILRLKPDWVLAWKSGNGDKIIRKLRALGIKVYVSEPGKLESIAELMQEVGELAQGEKTEQAVTRYRQKYRQLQQQYSQQAPVTVFYQVWNKPLQTLSNKSVVGDVISLCGGKNSFADALAIAPKTNVESVLRADPEAIVASGMGEERPQWLDDWQAWPQLTAVKNKHLFFVHPDLIQRHTPRLLQGAEILCQQLQQVRQARGDYE